jgi:hypothetical protein
MNSRSSFWVGVVATWLVLGTSLRGAAPPVAEPPVLCPAVSQDDMPRTNALVEDTRQPELIVRGRVLRRRSKGSDTWEVAVEKALYGRWAGKTIRFSSSPHWPLDRGIYALVPSDDADQAPFQLRYSVAVTEEKAMLALARARLERNSLAARIIFTGTEVRALDDFHRRVQIERVIRGPADLTGKRVNVALPAFLLYAGAKPRAREGKQLFFIYATAEAPRRAGLGEGAKLSGPVYHTSTRLPAELVEDVKAALRRRESHPVRRLTGEGQPPHCREVMFQGTTAEAIDLLASESAAAVTLGARKLVLDGERSRLPVVKAIDARLFDSKERAPGDFRRLHHLIGVLGALEGQPARNNLRQLSDRLLKHVEARPDRPSLPARDPGYFGTEENQVDANHTLTWLLQELGEAEVQRRLTERLLRLRERAKGAWKAEIQLALDASPATASASSRVGASSTSPTRTSTCSTARR